MAIKRLDETGKVKDSNSAQLSSKGKVIWRIFNIVSFGLPTGWFLTFGVLFDAYTYEYSASMEILMVLMIVLFMIWALSNLFKYVYDTVELIRRG